MFRYTVANELKRNVNFLLQKGSNLTICCPVTYMNYFPFQTQGCSVCRRITNATHWLPPILDVRETIDVGLQGEWVSRKCETRPNGQYLTRHLTFLMNNKSWQGMYEFYKDALCSEPSFKIEVKGTYVKGQRSSKIHSAYNYIFKTSRLKITPLDFHMVSFLNGYYGGQCGKAGTWRISVTNDVTDTNGCATLGITLPNIEYELMKTEYEERNSFLHVGQRPSDFETMSTPKNRPTSFQDSLVKCGASNDVSEGVKPVVTLYSGYSSDDNVIQANTGAGSQQSVFFLTVSFTVQFFYHL